MTTNTKYPNIHVELTGHDGNAIAILGRVRKALRRGAVPPKEVALFFEEATAGDYNDLLATCMRWVDVS